MKVNADDEAKKYEQLKKLAREGFDQLDQGKGITLYGRQELHEFIKKIGQRASMKVKLRKHLKNHGPNGPTDYLA